ARWANADTLPADILQGMDVAVRTDDHVDGGHIENCHSPQVSVRNGQSLSPLRKRNVCDIGLRNAYISEPAFEVVHCGNRPWSFHRRKYRVRDPSGEDIHKSFG